MTKKKFSKKSCVVMLLFFLLIELFISAFPVTAVAEERQYSNVLDDLKKDSSFNPDDYPAYTWEEIKAFNENNDVDDDVPMLSVITIAESKEKELFLYVYNPTRLDLNFSALEISMYFSSEVNPQNINPELYGLELLSNNGVFDKYLVEDYVVSDEAERHYNIVEISRPFLENIDTSISGGTTDDKAISVGKQFCCYFYNNESVMEMRKIDVVEITPVFNGDVFLSAGFKLGNLIGLSESCDVHFIAFNVDNYNVDDIIDADMVYKKRSYKVVDIDYTLSSDIHTEEYGDYSEEIELFLSKKDEVSYEGDGWFASEYKWNRIMKASDFVTKFEEQGAYFSDESKNKLNSSQWVFAFDETTAKSYSTSSFTDSGMLIYIMTVREGIQASKVDILRLHFRSEGKYYNLGVVMDKTSADIIPDGSANTLDFSDVLDLLELIILLLVIVILGPFLIKIVGLFFGAFKMLLEILLVVISLPFKILRSFFRSG